MTLNGKIAIVTGSARGESIGEGIALRLAKEGATVVCCDIREPESTIAKIESDGGKAVGYMGDITKWESCKGVVDMAVEKFGRVDILVNCAGISSRLPIEEEPLENFDLIMDINLRAVWMMCRAVFPVMKENNFGRIINIASEAGVLGWTRHAVYGASKGGVINLTRCLALEGCRDGITVNSVNPMTVPTQLFVDQGNPLVGKNLEASIDNIPMGTLSYPSDVAGVVNFFAGPDAGYVTGQYINVDGGFSAGKVYDKTPLRGEGK